MVAKTLAGSRPAAARAVFGQLDPWTGAIAIAFSPDGRRLAWANQTRVIVEDIASGARSLEIVRPHVRAIAFVADQLVTLDSAGTVSLFAATGALRFEQSRAATAVAATRIDGGLIAIATKNGDVIEIAATDGTVRRRMHHELVAGDEIVGLGYTGSDVLSFSRGQWIRWRGIAPDPHHNNNVSVSDSDYVRYGLSPGGDLLAVIAANRRTTELFELTSSRMTRLDVVVLAITATGGLVTADPADMQMLRVISRAGQVLARVPGRVGALVPSPDGRTLATHRSTGSLTLVDLVSGAETARAGAPALLRLTPDGSEAYVEYADKGQHWHVSDGRALDLPFERAPLAISPDGSRVVVQEKHRFVVRSRTGALVRAIEIGNGNPGFFMFTGGDELLFMVQYGDLPPVARRMDLGSGVIRDVSFTIGTWLGVAFSAKRGLVAAANMTRGVEGVEVYDLKTSRLVRRLEPGRGYITFADDGRALVSLDAHGNWWRWDVDTGRVIARTVRLGGEGAAFAPDGSLVARIESATETAVRRLVVYDTASFTPIADIELGIAMGYTDLAFSADGRTLAIALHDGRIIVFDVATLLSAPRRR